MKKSQKEQSTCTGSGEVNPSGDPSVEFALDVLKGGGVRFVSLNGTGVGKVHCKASEMIDVCKKFGEVQQWMEKDVKAKEAQAALDAEQQTPAA